MSAPGRRMAWRALLPAAAVVWCLGATRLGEGMAVCGFRLLTGLPCPLCGMTRALAALSAGRWDEALRLHLLSPLAVALLLLFVLQPALPPWTGWKRVPLLSASVFAVYGLLRIAWGVAGWGV